MHFSWRYKRKRDVFFFTQHTVRLLGSLRRPVWRV